MATNNNINYGPAGLPGTVPTPVLGNNIDRAPAPVAPGVGTGYVPTVSRPVVPVTEQPVINPPITVTRTAVVIPVVEQPVAAVVAESTTGPDIAASNQQRYLTILANGSVVTDNASSLDFEGNGFTITSSGPYGAVISISAAAGGYGNSNVSTFLAAFGSNTVSTTGNVTAGYVFGNGSQLTGITGTYGNANVVANLAALGSNPVSTTGTITAGNVTGGNILTGGLVSATSTITSAANITGGNLLTGGLISATGNITGNYILGNGSQLTSINAVTVDITDTNGLTTVYYPTFVENRTTAQIARADVDLTYRTDDNLLTVGNVSVTSNITGGNLLTGGLISATSTITSAANVTGGNVLTAGLISATGTITSAANITGGNLLTGGLISATGNITGGNILGGANVNATTHTGTTVSVTANITGGNVLTGGLVSAAANITGGNILTAGIISATGTITSAGNLSLTGNIVDIGEMWINTSSNGNINLNPNGTGNVNIPVGVLSVTGNITGGNISTAGNITGNTAGFAIGYRDIPQVSLAANVTTALTDAGKHYYSTSASNLALTIANNTSVVWPIGTAISIVNRGTANITIAPGSGVSLYLAGNSTSANRTVTTYGMATVMNVAANIWMINGTVV